MKKGIFVAGTGTGVGKTYVSALLVRTLRKEGIRAGYFKPALSGAYRRPGGLVPGDAEYVCRTAGLPGPPESYTAYLFEPAVSPHLAARMAGRPIREEEILRRFHEAEARFDYIAAEGCGGIFCPLRDGPEPLLLTGAAAMLGFDIMLVSPSGLGAINAAVLSAEHAAARGLRVHCICLNQYEEDNFMHRDNLAQIERFTGLPAVCVPRNAQTISTDLVL